MTFEEYAKLLFPILGSFLAFALYVGRKLQVLDDLKAAGLPERVAHLEAAAGVQVHT